MARTVNTPRRTLPNNAAPAAVDSEVAAPVAVAAAPVAAAAAPVAAAAAAAPVAAAAVDSEVAAPLDGTAFDLMCREVHARSGYKDSVEKMQAELQIYSDATFNLLDARDHAHHSRHHQLTAAEAEAHFAATEERMVAVRAEMEAARVELMAASHNWTMYRKDFPANHVFPWPTA
jgi:hypothetical protein